LYQANFASRIDGAPPFIRGVRARLFLIQQVISRLREILGLSLVTLDLGVFLWHLSHVFYCGSMCWPCNNYTLDLVSTLILFVTLNLLYRALNVIYTTSNVELSLTKF
jgi:hypothetical protein